MENNPNIVRLDDIIDKFLEYHPDGDPELLIKAFAYASKKHEFAKRKSGLPYIIHPISVAYIVACHRLDIESIAAAFLHDVVEDTDTPLSEIEEEFGKEVARLVDGLTKVSAIESVSKEEKESANFRKLLVSIAKDPRVLIIKLADRLDNMRTLDAMPEHKQIRIAKETLDIYAPLAHAIGMGRIKNELEDLCFKYLWPEEYNKLVKEVEERKKHYKKYQDEIYEKLLNLMAERGIKCYIQHRIKHLYSIYRKIQKQNITLNEVYDFLAFRIIIKEEDISKCYEAMGEIHANWVHIPNRWRDFIARPKQNGYQSLHTTLIHKKGIYFEVQIRTESMHKIAEEGIAAHWQYKQGKVAAFEHSEIYNAISKVILRIQENSDKEFLENFRENLGDLTHDITVLTPKGKPISLPEGATPVDFAYAIHTEVGNKCSGAKVDGILVPLNTELKDGNIVEILTSSNGKPSLDWLKFVKTNKAKNKIKAWHREYEKQEKIEEGKILLEQGMRKFKIPFSKLNIEEIAKKFKSHKITSPDDLYFYIAKKNIPLMNVLETIEPEVKKKPKKVITLTKNISEELKFEKRIRVKGIDNILVTRAKCCNPILGDEIIGYLTKTKGITIHRKDCKNIIKQLKSTPEKFVEVEWVEDKNINFTVTIEILAEDITGMLARLTNVFEVLNIHILKVSGTSIKPKDQAQFKFVFSIGSKTQLESLINRIKGIKGVIAVWRKR